MTADAGPSPTSADPRVAVLVLRDAPRIGWVFNRLHHARGMLAVRIPGSRELHTSLVLDADAAHGILHIDEPYPLVPAALLAPGRALSLSGRVDGNHFSCSCRIEQMLNLGGAAALRLHFPQELQYHERRSAFRVPIPIGFALPPASFEGPEGRFRGTLVDISRGGVCALLPAGVAPAPGSALACQVELPRARLAADVEVRSLSGRADGQRVGLRFVKLDREQEQRLSQAIGELERRVIRKVASHA